VIILKLKLSLGKYVNLCKIENKTFYQILNVFSKVDEKWDECAKEILK